jgi:hypothetical protein
MITTDQWTDYLIYRFYPQMRIYIDGRSDFYGPSLGKEYVRLSYGQYNWRDTVNRHRFDVALIPVEWSLASLLKADPRWRLVEDDAKALLFVKVGGVNGARQTVEGTGNGKKRAAGLTVDTGPSDHPMGDCSGMKEEKPAPQSSITGASGSTGSEIDSGWRLPCGLQLAEFALRGGFIAPGLLPKPNLSTALPFQGRDAAGEAVGKHAGTSRVRGSRKTGPSAVAAMPDAEPEESL